MTLHVLYEDNHLLVVSKPAGIAVQADKSGRPSLLDLARDYRKSNESKLGNVFVGLVHRLDRPVSGVIVLAKTSKAAARLSEQFRTRSIQKSYLAIATVTSHRAEIPPLGDWSIWNDEIKRNEDDRRPTKWQLAVTHASVLARQQQWVALALRPITGRKHQLRVQSANRGLPIVGDLRYGSNTTHNPGIALHATRLRLVHPTLRDVRQFSAPIPASWDRFPFRDRLVLPDLDG